ncbi:MAG: YbaN family protein [Erysipelotrichaceae bacterium]
MRIKTLMLTGLGFTFLGVGAIGVFVPIWPTTPFVLLSIACFSTTPHLKKKIMEITFFKEHFENYENQTGLTKKTVFLSLVWLWGMLILSIIVMRSLEFSILLILIGVTVTCHILWMAKSKDKRKDMMK